MIKDTLLKCGAIKTGDFTLTSGKKSKYYVDIKESATDPAILAEIAAKFASLIKSEIIGGMELGAVPLTVATALETGKRYVIIRKERSHGTKKLLIGTFKPGEIIDLLEDVVTTGGSVLKAAQTLRDAGAVVERSICVVDREEGAWDMLKENGIELISMVKISEIL
ncbi:orotate phosphoribosyltransferase [Oxyplasma meridianum]|uniref:Orotate phosphoribosyltransferase n=1 Tax=Oxyplasma meridianum TaxID=3073602 RepID=A0AAX4NFG4_9ARCH